MLGNIQHILIRSGTAAILISVADAFPPAPYYTIYGFVRDQVGQRVSPEGPSEIVLLKDFHEVARSPLTGTLLDQNYELTIRLDANRQGTSLYRTKAFPVSSSYSLAVDIAGVRYYPIEASQDLRVGIGGERLRLDLNLGQDSDGDGLPDVWEEWQLYQAGRLPDENGQWDLSLLSREGDFDKDGLSDGLEYVAGTFAGDAGETFSLAIKGYHEGQAHFEFYQIIGKVYTLEASSNGKEWQRVPFQVGAQEPPEEAYQANAVGIVAASAPSANPSTLYRLTVR